MLWNISIRPRITNFQTNWVRFKWFLSHSFIYQANLLRNKHPIDLRETIRPSKFKSELIEHIWNHYIKSDYENSIANVFEDYKNYNSESDSSDQWPWLSINNYCLIILTTPYINNYCYTKAVQLILKISLNWPCIFFNLYLILHLTY